LIRVKFFYSLSLWERVRVRVLARRNFVPHPALSQREREMRTPK
jgi:hypothetical protein